MILQDLTRFLSIGSAYLDTSGLANEIAAKVVADTSFWISVVGLVGVVLGAVITVAGNFLLHLFQDWPRRKLDDGRKELLEQMLTIQRALAQNHNAIASGRR